MMGDLVDVDLFSSGSAAGRDESRCSILKGWIKKRTGKRDEPSVPHRGAKKKKKKTAFDLVYDKVIIRRRCEGQQLGGSRGREGRKEVRTEGRKEGGRTNRQTDGWRNEVLLERLVSPTGKTS